MPKHPVYLTYTRKLLDELLHPRFVLPDRRAQYASLLKVLYKHVQRVRSKRHLSTIIRIFLLAADTSCCFVGTETIPIKKVGSHHLLL